MPDRLGFFSNTIWRSLFRRLFPDKFQKIKKARMMAFFSKLFKSGDVCFDIGAHEGRYSEVFLALGARVVAVEPVSQSAGFIRRRFLNKDNFTLVQMAASSSLGQSKIFLCNRIEISSMSNDLIGFYGKTYGHTWESSEEVELTTLDKLIEEYGKPSFCKIDVEGHELEVFKGLHSALPCLSFEFNYPFREQSIACIHHLTKLSFVDFNYSVFEEFKFQSRDWLTEEEMISILRNMPERFLTGDIYARKNN